MTHLPAPVLGRTVRPPRLSGRLIVASSTFTALTVGAVDLLQGATWPATFTLIGLSFATTMGATFMAADREGA